MNVLIGAVITIIAQYIAFSLTNKIITKWEQRSKNTR